MSLPRLSCGVSGVCALARPKTKRSNRIERHLIIKSFFTQRRRDAKRRFQFLCVFAPLRETFSLLRGFVVDDAVDDLYQLFTLREAEGFLPESGSFIADDEYVQMILLGVD